jgi:hypothetical protein
MTYMLKLLLFLLPFSLLLPNPETPAIKPRSVMVVQEYYNGNRLAKAIRLSPDSAELDNNYDLKNKIFHARNKKTLNSDPLFHKLFDKPATDWKKIQQALLTWNCDTLYPFMIRITEGTIIQNFYLRNAGPTCQPDSLKALMDNLNRYFQKM